VNDDKRFDKDKSPDLAVWSNYKRMLDPSRGQDQERNGTEATRWEDRGRPKRGKHVEARELLGVQ